MDCALVRLVLAGFRKLHYVVAKGEPMRLIRHWNLLWGDASTMSNHQELKTSERDTTVTPHQLRTAGYTPASVYGKDIQSQSIQVRTHEFYHAFLQGQREFKLNGYVSGSARVKNLTRNPVTQYPIAVEFHLESGSTEGKQKASS